MMELELSEETAVAPTDIFLDGKSITELELDGACQTIIARLHETNDTSEVESAITNLNGVEIFAAKAKSKLVFGLSQWYKSTRNNDGFADWYIQKFGGEKLTVQKHEAIGELLMDAEVPAEVKTLPNKELISVARAHQSGYDLTEHWDEIQIAGSEQEVNAIVRKVKGKEPRSGALTIKVYKDGTIRGFMGEVVVNLGWLNYQDRDETPNEGRGKVLKMGIARIINNTRMKIE
jgi:hypothetical protein